MGELALHESYFFAFHNATYAGSKDTGWAMANEDHVARLKQGVAAWNAWCANEYVVPDLSGANLHGENLREADLNSADLQRAYLHDADLGLANLRNANLRGADLRGASLLLADLRDVNLGGASLSRVFLRGAILNDANLNGVDLSSAVLDETFFTDVALTNVIGLDTCEHQGPSIIDYRTLEKNPNLRLVFLRGVGLPDRLIDSLPSLLNQPIQLFMLHQLLQQGPGFRRAPPR